MLLNFQVNSVKKMNFVDISKVEVLTDDEHVVLLYFKSRILRLSLKDISPFLQSLQQNMKVRKIKILLSHYLTLPCKLCLNSQYSSIYLEVI